MLIHKNLTLFKEFYVIEVEGWGMGVRRKRCEVTLWLALYEKVLRISF